MGSIFGPNRSIAKDVNNCTVYTVAMSDARQKKGRNLLPWTVGISNKSRAINELVVCNGWVSRVYRPTKGLFLSLLSTVPWGMIHSNFFHGLDGRLKFLLSLYLWFFIMKVKFIKIFIYIDSLEEQNCTFFKIFQTISIFLAS